MQDAFIGNLRAARDIARGTQKLTKNNGSVDKSDPNYNKNVVDRGSSPSGKDFYENFAAASNGARFDTAWNNPAENIAPGGGLIKPLSYMDVQRIKPYVDLFNQAINEYSMEPDSSRRIEILDNYGRRTNLGSLPGMASYLQVLRNTEEAANRENIGNYRYTDVADSMRKRLEAEIKKFYPSA